MKYYAKLRDNTVSGVFVVADSDAPDERSGADHLTALTGWPDWVASPRPDGSVAWISGTYDSDLDEFVAPPEPNPPVPEDPQSLQSQ